MILRLVVHFGVVAVLAAAAFLVSRRKSRAELGHILWSLVFVKLLIPPFLELPLLPASEAEPVVIEDTMEQVPSIPMNWAETATAIDMKSIDLTTIVEESPSAPSKMPWGAVAISIGAIGAIVLSVRTVFGVISFRRLVSRGREPEGPICEKLAAAARAMGVRAVPRLVMVDAAIPPAVWPGKRGTLVLPRALLARLDDEAVQSVLLHEMAHVARRDHWLRLIEVVVVALYWWLPPVWWFRQQRRALEEICCDLRVVRARPSAARAYADALIESAEFIARCRRTDRLATAMSARMPLERRIRMIMSIDAVASKSRFVNLVIVVAVVSLLPILPAQEKQPPAQPPAQRPANASPAIESFGPLDLDAIEKIYSPPDRVNDDDVEPPVGDAERAMLDRIVSLIAADDIAKAEELLIATKTAESSATFDFTHGNVLLRREDFAAAESCFESAVRKYPKFRRAWSLLGITSFRMADPAKASAAFRRAIELGMRDARTYGLLATSCLQSGDLERAETAFWMASHLDPDTVDWKLGLINVLMKRDRDAEALALMDDMVKSHKPTAELRRVFATSHLRMNRPQDAARELEALRADGRLEARDLVLLGNTQVSLGSYAAAASSFLEAIGEGADADPIMRAVQVMIAKGASEDAARIVKALGNARSDVDVADLLRSESRNAASPGDEGKEIDASRKRLSLAPDDVEAMLLLARLLDERGSIEEAEQLLKRAVELGDALALVRYGQFLVAHERYEEALIPLRRAQNARPRNSVNAFIAGIEKLLVNRSAIDGASTIRLSLRADGGVFHAGKEIGLEGVRPLIARMLGKGPKKVVIDTDRDAKAASLVRLVDEVKLGGIKDVSISSPRQVTLPAPDPKSSDETPPDISGQDLEKLDFDELEDYIVTSTRSEHAPVSSPNPSDATSTDRSEIAPRCTYQPAPILTNELRSRTPATVTLVLTINESGEVSSLEVQASTDERFNQSALDAAAKWRFEPAKRDGKAIALKIQLPITFPQVEKDLEQPRRND